MASRPGLESLHRRPADSRPLSMAARPRPPPGSDPRPGNREVLHGAKGPWLVPSGSEAHAMARDRQGRRPGVRPVLRQRRPRDRPLGQRAPDARRRRRPTGPHRARDPDLAFAGRPAGVADWGCEAGAGEGACGLGAVGAAV